MSPRDQGTPEFGTSLPILEDSREVPLRAWVRLARVYNRVVRRVEQGLGRRGLSLAQFDVLVALHFGEGMTQQELARALLVTKGNVCGLLDRVGAAGWVERRPDPEDRRANRLYLTEAGRRLVVEILPVHNAFVLDMMGSLDESEARTLHDLLGRIDADDPSPGPPRAP